MEDKIYKCDYGKEFMNKQSYCAHCGHREKHLGYKPKDTFGDSRAWSRGLTKETNESIARVAKLNSERLKELGEDNPLIKYNKNKPDIAYQHQSETRKSKYASGELTPAPGVGRGKYSYLIYGDNKILLRSTYEVIYALYLLDNNTKFEYEKIRARYDDHTYISDFSIGNEIVEIKGIKSFNETKPRLAFESLGYKYRVIYPDELMIYKESLIKYSIDSILQKVVDGHNKRDYYIINFDELK